MKTPEQCPVCGADLDPGVRACPDCGSDETTGWSSKAEEDPLGLDQEEFDYKGFVEEEFGNKPPPGFPAWVKWVAGTLLVLIVAWWISRF